MFGRSSGTFDRLVEKATSQLLLEPDWDSILQICDAIRQGDVLPKYVIASLKKKINQENPHVALYALQVLECSVKNCGSTVHDEIATKEFMEYMKELLKKKNDPVKAKILELIQVWSHAFRNEASYKVVVDTFHMMKAEGHTFPALREADAMFMAEKAPEWKDSECCNRCRAGFTTFQRKHHCRNCGQIFCGKCTSKQSIIPRFGIEREVRVCDACFDELNKAAAGAKKDDDLPSEYVSSSLAQQPQSPPQKTEQEIQEEEELQLAIALSQSEAEAKKKTKPRTNYNYGNSNATTTSAPSEPTYAQPTRVSGAGLDTSDMDPELARYLNRNYWEQKQTDVVQTSTTQPSAPVAVSEAITTSVAKVQENYQNGETDDDEEQFLNALKSSIDIFVNRMKSNSQRGRSIATDSAVQTLFMTINAMHPQLMKHIQNQEDMRTHYEGLQDKLAQLKDAREALDVLRDEHAEKRRREQEELERQRQIQMAQKLEILRQKKQEYLEYQRQLALQRMQEQEREMHMRLEQQKHMQQMRAMQYAYPQVYMQQPPTFSPEGSPLHQAHPAAQGAVPYGASPAPGQPPMAVPPGAPGAPAVQPPPPGPGGVPTSQPVYNPQQGFPGGPQMIGAPGIQAPPAGAPGIQAPAGAPGSYQPQPQAQGPPSGPFSAPPGGYAPPSTTQPPGMAPTQQQQPAFTSGPGSVDYQSYNMQSLPPQGQPQPGPPGGQPGPPPQQGQQPYMAPPPQAQYVVPQGGDMPPGSAPLPQDPNQGQQQPPPQQQQQVAQLISFD